MYEWERKMRSMREEYKKGLPHSENNKKEFLQRKLLESPLIAISELENYLEINGLLGLSLKEKINVLDNQMALVISKYRQGLKKLDATESALKKQKYSLKIDELENNLKKLKSDYDETMDQYKRLYKEEPKIF
jgi:hypothetical protein